MAATKFCNKLRMSFLKLMIKNNLMFLFKIYLILTNLNEDEQNALVDSGNDIFFRFFLLNHSLCEKAQVTMIKNRNERFLSLYLSQDNCLGKCAQMMIIKNKDLQLLETYCSAGDARCRGRNLDESAERELVKTGTTIMIRSYAQICGLESINAQFDLVQSKDVERIEAYIIERCFAQKPEEELMKSGLESVIALYASAYEIFYIPAEIAFFATATFSVIDKYLEKTHDHHLPCQEAVDALLARGYKEKGIRVRAE